ncbi:MAG: hypothetical protein ACUZ8H_16070 [Candidatus Anammoxibacter sp.]
MIQLGLTSISVSGNLDMKKTDFDKKFKGKLSVPMGFAWKKFSEKVKEIKKTKKPSSK